MTGARKGGAWLLHLLGATALGMSGCHEIFAHAPSASVDSAPDITALADVSVDAPVTDARAPDAPDVMETGPAADLGDAATDAPRADDGCELTEGNAASWSWACNVQPCGADQPCNATLTDELQPAWVKAGVASLRFDCPECGFDSYVELQPTSGIWNLVAFERVAFWIYTETTAAFGWQDEECGVNPLLVLVDAKGRRRRLEQLLATQPSPFNASLGAWLAIEAPLSSPTSAWGVTDLEPGFDLAQVQAIQIHLNPWSFGLTAWIDDLTFLDATGGRFSDCGGP